MKKFIFRLETLLKMRSVHESTLKRDLEQAHQKWNQIKEREGMLQTQITTLIEEMKKKREEGEARFARNIPSNFRSSSTFIDADPTHFVGPAESSGGT